MGKDLRKMTRQEQVAYFKSKDFCGEELKVVMDAISYGISADYLQLFENTTLPIETMENMFTAMKEDYGVDSVSFLSTIQKGESERIILEALKSGVPLQELKRVFQKDMLPVELREKILPLIQGREAIPEKIGEKMEFITEAVKELKESLLRQDSFIADLRKSMEEKQDIFSALQKGAETEAEAGAVDDAYYAGQGKKYTENTAHFSPEEKQGALRQKNNPGSGTGIQARAQMQMQSGTGRDAGDILADKTAESCQQGYGSSTGRNGSKFGNPAVLGNLHVKRPLQEYRKKSVPNEKPPAGSSQISQRQYLGEQIHRPSSYHETAIKTKEPALHRKSDAPPGISRTGIFSRKGNRGKRETVQNAGASGTFKIHKGEHTRTKQQIQGAENPSMKDTGNMLPASVYAQPYTEKRESQISGYRKEKYLKSRERERRVKEADRKLDTGRKTDSVKTAGTSELQEICIRETPPPQMQYTAGTPASLQKQGNGNSPASDASHLRKRNAADSIRKRDGGILGRKRQDISSRKSGSKKDKSRNKNTKKDNSHKTGGKSRKDRAAALRLLSYASDKFSMKEQKDSLLKAAGDLLALKIKAAAANALLSIGAALLPALIPAFIIVLVITLLFNSPFSILLPKLSEEPGAVEVLAEYTEDFKEEVQEELADPGSGDETELIYEDYEGDGEPDNMADILMVYMVRHGFGDTATVMTQKNKRLLKDTFDEMTSLNISYRTELREQPYEEEDFWGNVTIRTEEVEIKIRC